MTLLEKAFYKFHRENPSVYVLFKQFAADARRAGHLKFSARTILHRIRWETSVVTREDARNPKTGKQLKINDHHSPYYSRMYMEEQGCPGFFETRAASVQAMPWD